MRYTSELDPELSALVDWSTSALLEVERVAQAAIDDDCGQDGGFEDASWLADGTPGQVGGRIGEAAAAMIQMVAVPRKIKADVAARRRLIQDLAGYLTGDHAPWNDELIRVLMEPFSEMPGYQEAWRPRRRA